MQRFILLALLALFSASCSGTFGASGHKQTTLMEHSGPLVTVDMKLLATGSEAACTSIKKNELQDMKYAAYAAGMQQPDFNAIRTTAVNMKAVLTFRDSNQACLPHLAAGVQSKPHAVLQKTWDAGNLLPQDANLAGLVSNLMKKPPKGEKTANPQLTLYNGEPVTCDYDMMDIAEKDGERIPGESQRELEVRKAVNSAVPSTPKGHRDRIMHGSQAGYGEYVPLHSDEQTIVVLFKPEAPLTAFTPSGTVFRLEILEDVLNFYRCYQIKLPAQWNIEAEDKTTTPPKRIRPAF